MNTSWNIFKQFVDDRTLSIQSIDLGEGYFLKAFSGPFELDCYLSKDGNLDTIDFETNYKDNSNKDIQTEVVTQFEKRDKTLKLAHLEGDVSDDGTCVVLLKIPGTIGSSDGRWISAGVAFFDVHTPGDKVIGVYFTDEDNILGNGSGSVIGSYTDDDVDTNNKGWAVTPPGFLKCEAIGGYGFAPAGFYIKIVGKKSGVSPSGKFYVNLEWGKIE